MRGTIAAPGSASTPIARLRQPAAYRCCRGRRGGYAHCGACSPAHRRRPLRHRRRRSLDRGADGRCPASCAQRLLVRHPRRGRSIPPARFRGNVPIYFEYYPHTGGGAVGRYPGGGRGRPGLSDHASRGRATWRCSRRCGTTHDVLLMDYRGTGRSGAVDCRRAAECAEAHRGQHRRLREALGARAALYSTRTGDRRSGRGARGARHRPHRPVRRLVRHRTSRRCLRCAIASGCARWCSTGRTALDGPDYPWYPHYAPAMRDKFNLACARAPECRAASRATRCSTSRRRSRGCARGPSPRTCAMPTDACATSPPTPATLAIVMFGGSPAYATVREVDAAARAFTAGDSLPLLRLMAETLGSVDSRDAEPLAAEFQFRCSPRPSSAGIRRRSSTWRLPPAQRVAQRDRADRAAQARSARTTYAPFTIDEYRRMPLDYAFIDECVRWPASARRAAPLAWGPRLSGCAGAGGVGGARQHDQHRGRCGGRGALSACASRRHRQRLSRQCAAACAQRVRVRQLVRRFMASLSRAMMSCAAAVPPVRLVPRFARLAGELPAAQARARQ